MTRGIIIIEDKTVSVTGNEVWMTAGEIAGLFHTGVPAVNAAIRAVRKSDVLSDYEVCRYIQLENGLYGDVYSLEIIIPVAFRLNTYYTHVFRTWLVNKALSKEKRQAYVMFIQNGKAGYC
ncbi:MULTISPECIES: RhuM protein [Bacteroides]|uniref:RhuM protein n=1 Tax=Bacteroides TaxID=816 RepID=UPI002492A885|nr:MULTISPECIES: RhuM protein [Bacteroides]